MESVANESNKIGSGSKAKERAEKLHKLHMLRTSARQLNHAEVVAEDARNKLPANFAARQRQADWLAANEKARMEAEKKGLDFDRIKLLNVSAIEAANSEKKKRKIKPDVGGFTDYESATARQYDRLVKKISPNMNEYDKKRREVGDNIFYGSEHVIQSQGSHQDKPQAIDNMVNDLEQQIMKRKSFSRRRTYNDEADVDFINEKNARFNKKLERFYGEHTEEIKQNLERGTAI